MKIKTLLNDPRGSLSFVVEMVYLSSLTFLSTILCYLSAFFWNIKIGKNCFFYGKTHFKKYPLSTIKIGNHCQFRSSPHSNFVGLNRACSLYTHVKTSIILIGDNAGFSGTSIGAYEKITIGKNVKIGANTTIIDFDWHESIETGKMESSPVLIENNVWVGMNCVILKGVTIGENTIIGANSVVSKSIPGNMIAAGNPAKVIRPLDIKGR